MAVNWFSAILIYLLDRIGPGRPAARLGFRYLLIAARPRAADYLNGPREPQSLFNGLASIYQGDISSHSGKAEVVTTVFETSQ